MAYQYPPQQGYPQQGYPPPQQGSYPPAGYPPQQGGFPPQQGYAPQGGYPPQGGGYPPQAGYGFPAPQQGYQAPPSLFDWFRSVDANNSGRIDSRELGQALQKGGIQVNDYTAQKIIAMFDKDNTGQIGFDEFQQMHPFVQGMSTGFKKRDKTGDGRLEGREVKEALLEGGYRLEEGTFQLMMRKFDKERRGYLGFDEYVALSVYLSNIRNTFGFYDRNRSGQVTFGFDAFVTACISVK